jgi:microcin C transport system substrate-binding protein
MRGEPKYKAGFKHFDYVNPDAPKGGRVVLAAIGTYDTFHRFALRGLAAAGSETSFYDSLLVASADESGSYYGLIAEKVEHPTDYSWIIFHINPAARFQDGAPIRAEDVVYSFNTFMEKGTPQFRQYYEPVSKVEVLDPLRVKFTLASGDREMIISLGSTLILPKQFWDSRDFSEPITEVPLGSGAFTVADYKIGQYVEYKRIPDYWAAELPVNKGRNNFDRIRFDYYRDDSVSLEAFKAGEYDFRQEGTALIWATLYTGRAFDEGRIVKEEIPHELPQDMVGFIFNIQRPIFADRRVRMALNEALDFEWMNKNLFYGQYKRTRSYFQNTPYAATGLPSPEELKILEPVKDKIPPEVFTEEYDPSVTDGSGFIRPQMRRAFALLKDAGWELRRGKLVNVASGEPMEFELLLYSNSLERVAIPLKRNLAKMGISMEIRVVDVSQFTNRLRSRDFDVIYGGYDTYAVPDSSLKLFWRSDYIDYTYNTAGVQDPAIDYLVDGVVANQENETALLTWSHAFDRVATWNHYLIPQWHSSVFRVAYKNRFSRPPVRAKYALGFDTWWIDPEKDAALSRALTKGR